MANANRFLPARTRLHALTAAAALALVAGLSSSVAITSDAVPQTPEAAITAMVTGQSHSVKSVMGKGATKSAAKSAAKPTKPPTAAQLHPRGIVAAQESFQPTTEQLRNAKVIIETGKKMGLPPRAWVIALSTSMQESTLRNLGDLGALNDHDSLGLFQQRPSSGWGTPTQIMRPSYAATSFYRSLTQVNGWQNMPVTVAAQTVQVSAFPDHYAKWEKEAGDMVRAFYGAGPYAKQAASLR